MGSAVDKRRKIYSLDSVAAVSKGIAADIFLEARWGMDVACSVAGKMSVVSRTKRKF